MPRNYKKNKERESRIPPNPPHEGQSGPGSGGYQPINATGHFKSKTLTKPSGPQARNLPGWTATSAPRMSLPTTGTASPCVAAFGRKKIAARQTADVSSLAVPFLLLFARLPFMAAR